MAGGRKEGEREIEREREGKRGWEGNNIWRDSGWELSKLIREINSLQMSCRIDEKDSKHIIVKMLKTKYKEIILKSTIEQGYNTFKDT